MKQDDWRVEVWDERTAKWQLIGLSHDVALSLGMYITAGYVFVGDSPNELVLRRNGISGPSYRRIKRP